MKEIINCYDAKCPVLILRILAMFLAFMDSTRQCAFTPLCLGTMPQRVTAAAMSKDAYVLLNDLPRHKFHILKRLSGK